MTETTHDLLTVGQVADRFGVTVRTLHHYDELGLLTPGERTYAGYRLYGAGDLERLTTIVVYRRLGFSLDQIAEILAGEGDLVEHLRRQRAAVKTRLDELHELGAALDNALETAMNNRPATTRELRDLFGDGFDETYAAEAEQRWGESDAWAQSHERTSRYTKQDWEEVKAETDAINAAFAAALGAGEPADSTAALDAAEAHGRHIHARFYDLSPEMHRALADMYVTDSRFAAAYEEIAPGLAAYIRDAIHANADRRGPGPSPR